MRLRLNLADLSMAISKAKASHKDELQRVPGVGPSIADDLRQIGVRRIADLKGKSPSDSTRAATQSVAWCRIVACDVFRCAGALRRNTKAQSKKLDWWAWKDQ